MIEFHEYLTRFEEEVIARGIREGCLGKIELVPARLGRLSSTPFGDKVGLLIENSFPFAVDYYGHYKKTSGVVLLIQEIAQELGKQVGSVSAPVVHFASIRIEKVAKLAPELVVGFTKYKKELLDLRGFEHSYEL
jgi:hypothetical protein